MNPEERALRAWLARTDHDILVLNSERQKHMRDLALLICPHKVGDTVPVKGHAFTDELCVVTKILGHRTSDGIYSYWITGLMGDKDGAAGLRTVGWDGEQE